ncbi:VanW family protein [Metabacillus litoralis]|uniref:VanW family protein n=1 Tax=Metabacillus litoralis TaxID=152268 RepID=UPI001CFD414E|nr:VanW family protein [Metabacillus litoralis]
MVNVNKGVKLFVVLLFSVIYLISFSQIGVKAYDFFANKGSFEPGTQIASVNIENLTSDQAKNELDNQLASWFKGKYLQISINEQNIVIDQDYFNIDSSNTIAAVVNGKTNPIVASINQEVYETNLKSELGDRYATIDHTELQSVFLNALSKLTTEQQFFLIQAFVKADLNTIAAENFVSVPSDNEQVKEILDSIGTITVPAQSQVSFLELTKDTTKPTQQGLSIIASALYQTMLLTNFEIVERHTSLNLPKMIELGFEANIVQKKADLKWFNPNKTDYTIDLQLTTSGLNVTINGAPFLYKYEMKLSEQTSYPPKQIIRYTSLLDENDEKVVEEGKEGLYIIVTRNIFDLDGGLLESEQVSEDFYPPTHKIIETGLVNSLSNENSGETLDSNIENGESSVVDQNEEGSTSDLDSNEEVSEDSMNQENEEVENNDEDKVIWENPSKVVEK